MLSHLTENWLFGHFWHWTFHAVGFFEKLSSSPRIFAIIYYFLSNQLVIVSQFKFDKKLIFWLYIFGFFKKKLNDLLLYHIQTSCHFCSICVWQAPKSSILFLKIPQMFSSFLCSNDTKKDPNPKVYVRHFVYDSPITLIMLLLSLFHRYFPIYEVFTQNI
jgi:hypothetical protein